MDPQEKQTRFISRSLYVPTDLCFDKDDNLWALGWQRDPLTKDVEEKQDYQLVRKFSAAGVEIGRYLPRSLWPNPKAFPGAGGRGYWRMYAASDRIGAVIHENHADTTPEFVEWNLDGKLIRRTEIPNDTSSGRAYTSDGRFYVRVREKGSRPQLRVLDPSLGTWTPLSENLPERIEFDRALLLGADGEELVYRVGHGNTR